jgi:hypothetical protein
LQDQKQNSPEYFNLAAAKELTVSDASFEALYGRKLPQNLREKVDVNTTLGELSATEEGKKFTAFVFSQMTSRLDGNSDFRIFMEKMLVDMPMRSLIMMSRGVLTPPILEALVDVLNGKPCTDPMLKGMLGL